MAKIYGSTTTTPLKPTGGSGAVDQNYSPDSANAQSGKAVAQAVSGKMDKFGTVDDFDKSVTMSGKTIYNSSKKSSLTLDDLGAALSTEGVLVLDAGSQIEVGNKPIKNLATPDGTDPKQAVNVEYAKKARGMRLICKKTVTAEDATYFIYNEDVEKKPINLDEMYMFVNIPSGTSSCNMVVYINGVLDVAHTFSYQQYSSGASAYWVHAERIADGRWKTLRATPHATPSSRQVYSGYDLEVINYINTIRLNNFVAGITFEIWGRDAI